MKKFWQEGSKNIGKDHHWTHKLFSLDQKSALHKFARNVPSTNYRYFCGGGSYCLIRHFVQYTIVKATWYPLAEMTIVCARYIPCKKQKLWKSLLKLLLSSKALLIHCLALQTFFNFWFFLNIIQKHSKRNIEAHSTAFDQFMRVFPLFNFFVYSPMMIETTEINASLRKGAACRYCFKVLSKRRVRQHESKCVAVNFPIPDGYRIERGH